MLFDRFVTALFWAFLAMFGLAVFLSFGSIAAHVGALCDTDLDCAEYVIETCEEYQEPFMCGFPDLPDNAVMLACASYPDSYACMQWYNLRRNPSAHPARHAEEN